MTDEVRDEEVQEKQPDWGQFGIVVERKPVRFGIPTLPEEFFIEVRSPDNRGDRRIETAGLNYTPEAVEIGEDGEPGMGAGHAGIDGWAVFIEKCHAQIVDFCLPNITEDGHQRGQVTFKKSNDGRNSHNTAVYEGMNGKLADYVEGAMDYVAGRRGNAREAFEAFLSEQPGLRRT